MHSPHDTHDWVPVLLGMLLLCVSRVDWLNEHECNPAINPEYTPSGVLQNLCTRFNWKLVPASTEVRARAWVCEGFRV